MSIPAKLSPLNERARYFFPDGGRPSWEVAYLFPAQGMWTDDEYFSLETFFDSYPLIELSRGRLEVVAMPTESHQLILAYFYELLKAFADVYAPGKVLFAGMRVRLWKGKFRAPDVLYMKAEHSQRRKESYWEGADLTMEVVSPDPKDRQRDWEIKPREYARARIPEYWIIDPHQRLIRVLTLDGRQYRVHGDFGLGMQATSVLLPGFSVAVDAVFQAGESTATE